jgi:hypothetical protein
MDVNKVEIKLEVERIRFIKLNILTFIAKTQYINLTCMFNFVILIIAKKSVINMRIKILNNLPLELKSVENFTVYKRKLKSYLLHGAFCALQVFFKINMD